MYFSGDLLQEQLGGSTMLLVSFMTFIGIVIVIMAFPFLINTNDSHI